MAWENKQLEVHFQALSSVSPLRNLMVVAHVTHGPLVFTSNKIRLAQAMVQADVELSAAQSAALRRSPLAPALASIRMLIELSGAGIADINSNKFSYESKDTKILWQGLTSQFDFSSNFNEVQIGINFLGMDIETPQLLMVIDKMNFFAKVHRIAENFWVGERDLLLQFLHYKVVDWHELVVNNLHCRSDFKRNIDGTIGGDASVQNALTNLDGNEYKDLDFVWHVDKLDAKVLAEFAKQVRHMKNFTKPPASAVMNCFESLLKLLNNDAIMSINKLNIILPQGRLGVTANALFKKHEEHIGGLLPFLANTHLLVNVRMEQPLTLYWLQQYYKNQQARVIAANANANADESLIEQNWQLKARDTLDELVRDKKLLVDDNFYNFSLNYDGNRLLLNGQPISMANYHNYQKRVK